MNYEPTDYSKVPTGYMVKAIKGYVEDGSPVGDFLTGIITNDLVLAVCHADAQNKRHLYDWVIFMLNQVPHVAWGSKEKMEKWMDQGGKQRENVKKYDEQASQGESSAHLT